MTCGDPVAGAGTSGMVSIACAETRPGKTVRSPRNRIHARVIRDLDSGVAQRPGGPLPSDNAYLRFQTEDRMLGRLGLCLIALAIVSCRSYQYEPKIASQGGLVPPDQFAKYGHDQAEAVAIGRELGRTGHADSAMAFAR